MATAIALGVFGSIDANRGDAQNGWDTDQFPNSVEECTLVMYEILKAGGFGKGGLNFDTKVRRQSNAPADLFHGHIGAIDVLALASSVPPDDRARRCWASSRRKRYAGWDGELRPAHHGQRGSLASAWPTRRWPQQFNPRHVSGEQERLENLVNRFIHG